MSNHNDGCDVSSQERSRSAVCDADATARVLLREASESLQVSRLLLGERFYKQAVFHMREATDRTAEGYALLSGDFRCHACMRKGRGMFVQFPQHYGTLSPVLASLPELVKLDRSDTGNLAYQQSSRPRFDPVLNRLSFRHPLFHKYSIRKLDLKTLDTLVKDIRNFVPSKLKNPTLKQRVFAEGLLWCFHDMLESCGKSSRKAVEEMTRTFEKLLASGPAAEAMLKGSSSFPYLYFSGYALLNLSIVLHGGQQETDPANAGSSPEPDLLWESRNPLIKRGKMILNILSDCISSLRRVLKKPDLAPLDPSK